MTKFCKDCKYYKCSNFDHPRCCNDNSLQPNLVSGEYYFQYCHDMRSGIGMCKSEAIFFEPKKPLTPPPTSETIRARCYNWFKTFWK